MSFFNAVMSGLVKLCEWIHAKYGVSYRTPVCGLPTEGGTVQRVYYIVPTLCVGMHLASLQRCVTQSVTGGIPTQSVGTIN